jgi:hypothetical protein
MAEQGLWPAETNQVQKAAKVYSQLRLVRPMTRKMLRDYVKVFLGIDVPDKKICDEHSSPLDYLWHSFNLDASSPPLLSSDRNMQGLRSTSFSEKAAANGDCVVWANRGGGKTLIAAVATLLDCIFKPACQVRILAGSGEQAGRMYDYLAGFIQKNFTDQLSGAIRKDDCHFINGSAVEVLTQSQASVRGLHIQKLRCDEVELFDPDVFAAAKFTTMSKNGIRAALESISTMHRPYGIMQQVISDASQTGAAVFKWCIWETIEKCVDRNCSQCPLWVDCQGKARDAAGFLKIDDCITAMRRSSRAAWESEMLCKRPSLERVVFDEFEPAVNVKVVDFNPNWPLYRAIDFGFVNPFVCLWIQVDGDGVVYCLDEYVRSRATIDVHAAEIKKRTPIAEEKVAGTFCDPAGNSCEQSSGQSQVRQLHSHDISVRYRRSSILEGVELIRRHIRAGDGKNRLIVSPRCPRLIEALQCYHYPDVASADSELPLKDGVYDHPIDALRYFFVNYVRPVKTINRSY